MTQTTRSPWIDLQSEGLRAAIDPLGAQLSVLQDRQGRDLLWDGDPKFWSGRAPLLFPIVGALVDGRYRLGSDTYPLSRHGFARGKPFDVVESDASSASLRLTADASTLAVYPFRFQLDVRFTLQAHRLSVVMRVDNQDSLAMPASFGYHPALRWPLPYEAARDAHDIEFAVEEPAPVRRLDAAGLLTPELHATQVQGRRLALTDALFVDDVVIFDQLESRSVTYGGSTGRRLRLDFPDATYLGLWSKPGAGFICIEPWHGVADPQGYAGDFTAKPGSFVLAPGEVRTLTMHVNLIDADTPRSAA